MSRNVRIVSNGWIALLLLVGIWCSSGTVAGMQTATANNDTAANEGASTDGARIPVVYLAGDSTVQTYRSAQRPQAGWGQMIAGYFDDGVQFSNRAIGGRSSRSFIEQGRLDTIVSLLQPGDYLMVQFGHNDADFSKPERYTPVNDYRQYLKTYIDRAHSKGATPILVTPVSRRDYNASTGQFNPSFPDYVQAMKQVAAETNTLLIDLNARSVALYNETGVEGTKSIFLHVAPGEYSAFPNGVQDNTHFQEQGAVKIAGLIAAGIQELNIPLSGHMIHP
ncbi:rhamnogalacturonan acetylesterase [Paenibacillus campi]|uniref:rhamnogalacturonan acetylesterase n=1 Tax=Paenibacillus campi TaxID=3106031 RepID=UPI002AFE6899|nr:rhamnogalacturonan acetylesterase [Paenibacillus sp. SGZ-1009]